MINNQNSKVRIRSSYHVHILVFQDWTNCSNSHSIQVSKSGDCAKSGSLNGSTKNRRPIKRQKGKEDRVCVCVCVVVYDLLTKHITLRSLVYAFKSFVYIELFAPCVYVPCKVTL